MLMPHDAVQLIAGYVEKRWVLSGQRIHSAARIPGFRVSQTLLMGGALSTLRGDYVRALQASAVAAQHGTAGDSPEAMPASPRERRRAAAQVTAARADDNSDRTDRDGSAGDNGGAPECQLAASASSAGHQHNVDGAAVQEAQQSAGNAHAWHASNSNGGAQHPAEPVSSSSASAVPRLESADGDDAPMFDRHVGGR